ncbi:MAG: LacI family DNA-binding transcriptional regulator [Eubacteriales bacterium]|nr:LacI family DNA-binding transcriptional regulator [Eubacteriales bacterium]
MRYKSKDIARELGVSPAAVSLVLNNKPGVGEELRNAIIHKIKELHCEYLFKEDNISSGDIGFVVYRCIGSIVDEYPFFNYLLESINKCASEEGYKLNIFYLEQNMGTEELAMYFRQAKCQGYIVYAVEMKEKDLKMFQKVKEPCVFLDNLFPGKELDVVSVDNYLGVSQAMEHLYKMGHREIGYIKSRIRIPSFQQRHEAYRDIMRKKGLPFRQEYQLEVGYLEEETYKDAKLFFSEERKLPTAFFAENDLLACRIACVMKEYGIQVPDDVSVIGFDDRTICNYTQPKMTTVAIAKEDMGLAAIQTLLSRIRHEYSGGRRTMISTKLMIRESVKRMEPKEPAVDYAQKHKKGLEDLLN